MNTLRNGYTTGTAATAALLAAYRGSDEPLIEVRLPGGALLPVPLCRRKGNSAVVIKDGGDDPDVTTGAEIIVEIHRNFTPEEADFCLPCNDGELFLRGGQGVGRVTRPGLAVPVGKAAINPGPRKMLAGNLAAAGFGQTPSERLLAVITIPEGEALAAKTLNPALGIAGGISILGNSGIVRPYSNAAYAATIQLQVKTLGEPSAAFVTGSRSADAVRRDFPELGPNAIIPIADFIHVALTAASRAQLKRVIVGCMPGKLYKYACGLKNTHAHKAELDTGRLPEFGINLSVKSIGELAARIPAAEFRAFLTQVYPQAFAVLSGWAAPAELVLALYDEQGGRIR